MAHKKVFSAPDAAPVVLYAKNDASSEHAFPLLQSYFNPPVLEYRSEYSGDNVIYEGWAVWIENGNSITGEVWRIAKHVYSGSNKIQTMYAGDGSYNYKWDDRVSLFPIEGVINFVFQDENNFIFQDGNNFIFREA